MTDAPPLLARPQGTNAALVLADGSVFWGIGLGAAGTSVGELCFNTSMTGYQEIMTDPSYAGQIITFTFPHIGNVGANPEDVETTTPAARGLVLRADITEPSNYRARQHFDEWLKLRGLTGLAGIDTRRLTRRIRDGGPPNAAIAYALDGRLDVPALLAKARAWPGLEGMDLAKEVSCRQSYRWDETGWVQGAGYGRLETPRHRIVAVDYGAKRNILRMLASEGCAVTVVPADASADAILRHEPDGIFLSNGPGDPAATGQYAVPVIRDLIASEKPIFGICLGHQIMGLALGGKTYKLKFGHHGGNQPVMDLTTRKVEITAQNHGFAVDADSLKGAVEVTHLNLNDNTVEGLAHHELPIFSVQYHPESSPGPHDANYLFRRFVEMMGKYKA